MPAIRTRDLVREYRLGRENRVRALAGVDLDVEAGERIAVFGRSGSGKSTLLNVVGGLDRPTAGGVAVGGTELADLSERELAAFRAKTVGFVFQSFHLQPRYRAWENVALPLVFLGVDRRERRRRALGLLEALGLSSRVQHRPAELSGGEQQRVAFARSLVAEPQVLLADEPTGNLDSETSRQIVELLGSAHDRGTTLLVVTHDRELAQTTADRVIRMADGRIVGRVMDGRASFASLVALAVDGLRRKIGRNLLTMSGVFIGVFALTLIVSLGEGMTRLVQTAVSDSDNLRQIGLSGGLGTPQGEEDEIEILGAMTDARRQRLRRSAVARSRSGTFIGRRVRALDEETLAELETIEHVAVARPIVLERYRMTADGESTEATATLGVDTQRDRYADRVIAGRYFSAADAEEVLIHEYLAYQWGLVSDEELTSLLGTEIVLEPIENRSPGGFLPPDIVQRALGSLDLSVLTEEERSAFPKIVAKLSQAMLGGGGEVVPMRHVARVVGVVREMEAGEPIRVIEDGNAARVDVFLPLGTATQWFFEQPVNREIGFGRSYVVVEESKHVAEVEKELRKRGFTAFSVASVIDRIEGFLGALTVLVALLTGVALFVAALGIVNTMVTSVLERTHEIGLWKAVGATSSHVRTVFLLEAAMIGLVGGLLGLLVAVLVQLPLDAVAARMIAERAAFPVQGSVFHMPAWLPVVGPGLAALVAMLAALYPAHRAARVDPVRALRHE